MIDIKAIYESIINESEDVLRTFEKEFPRSIVRANPKERPLEITEENMQKIFDILNGMFFGNKLEKILLKGMTLREAIPYFRKIMNEPISNTSFASMLGINFSKLYVDEEKEFLSIYPGSEFIYMQLIDDKKTSFGYAVATIMHEMIHYYDNHFGDSIHLKYLSVFENIPYDEHETKVFRKYMKMAIDKDILVRKDGNGMPYVKLNEEAQKFFLNLPVGKIELSSESNNENSGSKSLFYKLPDGTFAWLCP